MQRKIRSIFCVLILVFTFFAVPASAQSALYVNNPNPRDRLHLRESPDAYSLSLGKYYNGVSVTPLAPAKNGWIYVSVGGSACLNGYMQTRYLSNKPPADARPRYLSGGSGWELYEQPNLQAGNKMFGYGEEIRLLGFTDAWWHIEVGFQNRLFTGFVSAGSMVDCPTATIQNFNANDRLHLREEPAKDARSLGKFYTGVKVTVLGYYCDQQWARVRLGNLEGYMMTDYLAIGASAKNIRSAISSTTARGDALLDRPSANGKKIINVPKNASVDVWGLYGDSWIYVAYNGQTGYLHR